MRFRKLRIAWSVFWGLACVLPVVLWVKDYRTTRLVASQPYAFPILLTFTLAVAPWTNDRAFARFSLRSLLIATTLVAVGLGLAVWAASK
jgi:hypothetical protein